MTYKLESIFKDEILEYIEYKRNGGAKYITPVNILNRFDHYLCTINLTNKSLTREAIMNFITLNSKNKMRTVESNTYALRGFARFLVEIKEYNDICIVERSPYINKDSFIPYVFSDSEISKIIYNAKHYPNSNNIKPNTSNIISCAIMMLYCTGMRVSEILDLKVNDVDLINEIIHINQAKNNNKRIVTISKSLLKECERYIEQCKNINLSNVYFFDMGLARNNGKVTRYLIYERFRAILIKSNIVHKGRGFGPRLHDLRVTFCCHSLRKLTKLDIDINSYLVYLSTYMGHQSINETQHYLWLTFELYEDTQTIMDEYTKFIFENYEKETKKYELL